MTTARIEAGFTKRQEAVNRFGWNKSSYHSHENGNREYSFSQAEEYAKAYKVNAQWLYTGKGSKSPKIDPVLIDLWNYVPEKDKKVVISIIEKYSEKPKS